MAAADAVWWVCVGRQLSDLAVALARSYRWLLGEHHDDEQAAITEFISGLRLDPFWPTNWANLGVLQWGAGQKESAIASINEALDRSPHDPRFLAAKGWMMEAIGSDSGAEHAYETAVVYNPVLTQSIFLQQTPLRQGALLESLLLAFKNTTEQLTMTGWDQFNRGEQAAAVETFSSALALTPRSASARVGLAITYQHLGQLKLARQQADFALLGAAAEPRVLLAAGQIAFDQGRLDEASRLLESGWSQLENRNESIRYYGIVYRRAHLPFDTVPGLFDPTLTTDMAHALATLRDLMASKGDVDQTAEIDDYLKLQEGRLP